MHLKFEIDVNLDDEDITGSATAWNDEDDETVRDVMHDAAKDAVSSATGAPAGFITVNVTGGKE